MEARAEKIDVPDTIGKMVEDAAKEYQQGIEAEGWVPWSHAFTAGATWADAVGFGAFLSNECKQLYLNEWEHNGKVYITDQLFEIFKNGN